MLITLLTGAALVFIVDAAVAVVSALVAKGP